jgi:hypothetical protein
MRCVFVATGAYLGRIDGIKRCAFWTESPVEHNFDKSRLIDLDLSKTPSAAAANEIAWDEVEVDDCVSAPNGELSGTTLGPAWPELQLGGAVLLEQRFIAKLPLSLRPAPLRGGREYEFMSTLYWPNSGERSGARYQGHHAEIVEERGSLTKLRIYAPGSSQAEHTTTRMSWIDLASAEQCDSGVDSLTTVGIGAKARIGAVFLRVGG